MTQGYGPDHGQQGQWGQGDQNSPPASPWGQPEQQAPAAQPQWGQPSPAPHAGSPMSSPAQPQWGQASPSGAPGGYSGGYPGVAHASGMGTGPQFGAGDGVNWRRVKLIGLILLGGTALVLLVRLGINLAAFIGADDLAASGATGEVGAVGAGSSLVSLLLYGLNFLLGTALLVLGIIAAVMGRGRARAGGIVVAAAIPLSVILYWIFTFLAGVIWGIVTGASGETADAGSATLYYVTAVTGVVHALLVVAILALGSFFVHSTASKKLSA
ncbi:hypothetical protein [Brachybacterium sp.]|uniref:hypothetical protein n=1 Tax=Brachybacterium sp. TaxID=1891286 RepID=UPI002ED2848F